MRFLYSTEIMGKNEVGEGVVQNSIVVNKKENDEAWVCKKCGHGNFDEWLNCINCGNPKPV